MISRGACFDESTHLVSCWCSLRCFVLRAFGVDVYRFCCVCLCYTFHDLVLVCILMSVCVVIVGLGGWHAEMLWLFVVVEFGNSN